MLDWLKKMLFEVEDEVTEPEPQNIQTPAPEAVFIDIVERNEFFPDMKEEEFEVTKPLPQKQPDYWLSAVISPIYGEVTSPIKVMSEEPPLTPTVKQEKSGYLGTIISPMYGNAKQEIKPLTTVENNPEPNVLPPDFSTLPQPPTAGQPLPNPQPSYISNNPIVETQLPLSFENQPEPINQPFPQPQAIFNTPPTIDPGVLPPPNTVPTNDYDQYLEIKKVFPENNQSEEEVATLILPTESQPEATASFLPPDSELFGVEPLAETPIIPSEKASPKTAAPSLKRSKPKTEEQVNTDSLFTDFEANFATTELNALPDDFGKTEEVKFNKLDLFDGE